MTLLPPAGGGRPTPDDCRRCLGAVDQAQELLIRESEARIAAMTETFLEWAVRDAAQLAVLVDRLAGGGPRTETVTAIHDVLHNLKGQGGTFGFDLLSAVAESGCAHLRTVGAARACPVAVRHHVIAIDTIIAQRVRGDGGPLGAQLLTRLLAARTAAGEPPPPDPMA